jgi:hypothetical protein
MLLASCLGEFGDELRKLFVTLLTLNFKIYSHFHEQARQC